MSNKNTANTAVATKESDNVINMKAAEDSSYVVTAEDNAKFKEFMDGWVSFRGPIGNIYMRIRTALSISKAEVLRNINVPKSSLYRFELGFSTSWADDIEREYATFLITHVMDISNFDPSWHYVAMEITDTIGDLEKILERLSQSFEAEIDSDPKGPEPVIETFERLQKYEKVKASLGRVNLSLVIIGMIAEAIRQTYRDWKQTEEGKAF